MELCSGDSALIESSPRRRRFGVSVATELSSMAPEFSSKAIELCSIGKKLYVGGEESLSRWLSSNRRKMKPRQTRGVQSKANQWRLAMEISKSQGGVCGRCTCGLRSKRVVFSLSHHLRHDIIGDKLLRISVGLLLQNLDKILDLENGYVKYYGLVTRFTNVMYFRVQYHHQNEMGLK